MRLLEGNEGFVQIADLTRSEGYRIGDPLPRAAADLGGIRTLLVVPLRKSGTVLGTFGIYRQEVKPFSDRQIALVQSFANQAVIAIENARLFDEVRERQADLARSVDELTATGNVLKIISRSTVDLETVLDRLVETVARLCRGDQALLFRRRDDLYHLAAAHGLSDQAHEFLLTHPLPTDRGTLSGRVDLERRAVQIPDVMEDPEYSYREGQKTQGHRTVLGVPLLREDLLIGIFSIARTEVEPFTTKEIELATSFADQAVIAIENARLFDELRQSLQQQTATADVLKAISRSTFDLQTVLQTLVELASRLCDADMAQITRQRDGVFFRAEAYGFPNQFLEYARTIPVAADRGSAIGRALLEGTAIHIPDALADPEYTFKEGLRLAHFRAVLAVPMLREGAPIGVIVMTRKEARSFTQKQIELATTFADQAVIAIENARLFEEVQAKARDLEESLQQQTATSEVLQVISASPGDLAPVFEKMLENAIRVCGAEFGMMLLLEDGLVRSTARYNVPPAFVAARGDGAYRPPPGSVLATAIESKGVAQIADLRTNPAYLERAQSTVDLVEIAGARTVAVVPMLRENEVIGTITIYRQEVRLFDDKQIELVSNFAQQAVIAIENTRLLRELRDRQAELRVTFDNMGDGVVMFGADTRLVAWNRNFQTILDLPDAFLGQRPSYADYFRYLAERGEYSADLEAELSRRLQDTDQELRLERTRPDGRVIEVRRNPVPGGGFVLIYADVTERKRSEEAIRAARDAAETALRDLQAAQASLVHAQKMAALGQLTAGIAHEIKNPLNFVNNFAGLSVELLEELKEAAAQAIGALDAGKRAEILETIGMLAGNLKKIAEHGRRADGIVRGMLQHSRGSSGDWQATDLNALVEESLNLAYHGARAQDQDFKVTLELDLDRNLAPIEVVSQDLSRVLLNLISNGFYAVTKRGREGDGAFRPALKIATREFGEGVEIRVRDNGVGIPPEYCEKLFQPFFTTKPTGEGTGLGLSISYEIITQQHGGTITVDSKVGDFTEFAVRLPRRRHGVA